MRVGESHKACLWEGHKHPFDRIRRLGLFTGVNVLLQAGTSRGSDGDVRSKMAGAGSCYRLHLGVGGEKISEAGCVLRPAEEVPLGVRTPFGP